MQYANGFWHLADGSDVPYWITAIENDLALVIENR
jgi:hypothetical protein